MTKSGNKKRKKLSSSSSTEAASSAEGKGDEAFESEKSAAMATSESVNETPFLVDAWKVLTEIKANKSKSKLRRAKRQSIFYKEPGGHPSDRKYCC